MKNKILDDLEKREIIKKDLKFGLYILNKK